MDGVGQWRLIEPQEPHRQDAGSTPDGPHEQRPSFVLVALTAALVVAAAGVAMWATLPPGGAAVEPQGVLDGGAFAPRAGGVGPSDGAAAASADAAAPQADLVVDVQGAVIRPGVHTLPGGSRVADAIAAAGGYAPGVDISAASRQLNLAEKLVDGAQIRVPALGDEPQPPATNGAADQGPDAAGGLIDVNSATAEQLDTLPGIGPVTAAKIIDARAEAPFAAVDELLARGIVGASTFEKIRELVTVGQ